MTPRVVITGAAGFVGQHLVAALTDTGCNVIAIDRIVDAVAARALAGANVIEAPLAAVSAAAIGVPADALIHAAALTARPDEAGLDLPSHLAANVDAHLAALALAAALRVKRFVFISSAGVFSPGARPLDEDALPDAAQPYAAAKRMGEIATDALGETGIEAISVRLGNVYGPGEIARPSRPRLSLLQQMIAAAETDGRICVDAPDALRDWTFASDIGRCVAALLAAPSLPGRVVHVVAPQPATDRALAETIAGLRPGTALEFGTTEAAIRPPLASRFPEHRAANAWTPLEKGIALTLRANGATSTDHTVRPDRTSAELSA